MNGSLSSPDDSYRPAAYSCGRLLGEPEDHIVRIELLRLCQYGFFQEFVAGIFHGFLLMLVGYSPPRSVAID